jgi:tetratricopeptide (TPR) repeat protein
LSDLAEHIEALRRDPASDEVANAVRRSAREDGLLAEYAVAFTERAGLLLQRDMTKEAIGSLVEAALVYEEELEDLEAAAELYRKVLEIEGDHRRALFALGLLYHDLARWDDLIRLYRRRLEASRDDGERTTLHLYIAELLSERLHDDNAAFNEITTASRLAPRNIRIISRLEKLGELTNRIDEVAVVIGDLILHQEDPRVRAALSLRLAELHLGPLNDQQRALAYLRAALEDDGGNPEILSEVEDVFRERARFDELAEILEHAAKDRRVGPHRVRLERELARIYELELGDKRRALIALTRAVRNAPEDRELLDEVMRLGLMTQEMELVAHTFEEVLNKSDNALLRKYMRLKLGHIYADMLGRFEDAKRIYWALLEEDPSHKEARRRLHSIHERKSEHAEIARLLELEVQTSEGSSVAVPLRRLASIRRDRLDDLDGAVEAYRRILEVLPDDEEALSAVAANETGKGDRDLDLADRVGTSAVETRADELPTEFEGSGFGPETETVDDGAPPPIPVPIVSDLELGTMGQRRRPPPPPPPDPADASNPEVAAMHIFAELDRGAHTELAPSPPVPIGGAFAPSVGPAKGHPPALPTIAPGTMYDPLSPPLLPPGAAAEWETQSSQQRRLMAELEEKVNRLQADLHAASPQDNARTVDLLQELVRAYERLALDERAFFTIVRLAQVEPTVERLEETIRLGRRAQGYPLLIDTVDKAAKSLSVEAQIKLGMNLAELELEDMHDVAAATNRLQRLCGLAPDDPAVFERCTNVLERTRRYGDLVFALKERALRTAGTPESLSMVRRAVQLRETELGDPRGAAEILRAYLDRIPERDELRQEVTSLYTKAECWDDLAAFLESGIYRIEGEERTEVRLKIARLYLDRLENPKRAEEVLRLGLEERARDPELLALLEEIYEQEEDWANVVDVLSMRLGAIDGGRAMNAVRRRIAEIAEDKLHKIELALEVLGDAVREDPADLEALAQLERIRRNRGDWDGVLDALMKRANALADPEARAETLVQMAMTHAEAYGDFDGASDRLRGALETAPSSLPALEYLATVEERRGGYQDAVDTLHRLAGLVSGAERAKVSVRIGRIYERRLEDADAATAEYQNAYDADPHCLDAILALFRIRELEEDYVRAHDLAARAAEHTSDERDKAALFRRAAQIARDKVGDDLRALEYYEHALETDPEDLATAASIGELLFQRQEFERAYPYLHRAGAGLSDPARTAEIFSLAGQTAEKLKMKSEAIACYEAALQRSPRAFEPLRRLSALLEQSEAWPRVYELSAALILHHETAFVPIERAAIYLRMARAKRASGEWAAAARLAKRANQLAESLVEPLQLLADVLAEGEEPFEAAECLKRLAQLHKVPKDKRDALYRAAVLLADDADDLPRAAAMLAEAQTFVPEDIEVGERLAQYREELGDLSGAASALTVPARLLSGRARADLLVRAARIAAGSGRDRPLAKKLFDEALEVIPTHREAVSDAAVMFEFDEEPEKAFEILQRAALAFLDDQSTARDAPDLDRKTAAVLLFDEALRIARFRLDDPERALAQLRKLLELRPAELRYKEELARILDKAVARAPEKSASLVREAIGAWGDLVERQPGYIEGLNRLAALSMKSGETGIARIAAELLSVFGEPVPKNGVAGSNGATSDPRLLPAREKIERVEVPSHPSEASPLLALFEVLGHAPIRAFYELLPEPKPKKRDLVGAAGLGIHVSRPLEYAAGLLGVEAPPVYVRDDSPVPVMPALVLDQPALIVSLALAAKHSAPELRFLIARSISMLRPRALSLMTVPLDVMRDAFAGIAKPAVQPEAVHADPRNAKKRGKMLEKVIDPAIRNQVAELAGKWVTDPVRRSLTEERAAVLRTAERAGLVVSGSLIVTIESLKAMSEGRVERAWQLPLIEFAATRRFADIVRRLG